MKSIRYMIDTAQIPNTKLDFLSEGDRMKSKPHHIIFACCILQPKSTASQFNNVANLPRLKISILSAIMINMAPNKMQTAEFSTTAFGAA